MTHMRYIYIYTHTHTHTYIHIYFSTLFILKKVHKSVSLRDEQISVEEIDIST